MIKPKLLTIVIPVYNEDKFIEKTLEKVLDANSSGLQKEIIIVNDGSTDLTEKVLVNFSKNHKSSKMTIVNKKNNEGKGAALKDGFLKSTGDIVLIQDADLEYNPSDYPTLLKPFLENEADVVYGSRLATSAPHRVLYFWHFVINKSLTTLSNLFTNLNLTDMETGYKAFDGELIRKIAKELESKRFGFEPEITARISRVPGVKVYEVGISYSGRTYEEGKKIGWKDGILAIVEIIKFNIFK